MGKAVSQSILIVDDSPTMRRTLRRLFEASGWNVCGEAENGQQAIEKVEQLKPDLVTLDLSMPVMNGLVAARKLHGSNPKLPLVMFSMFEMPALEKAARESGCCAVINKLAPTKVLLESVGRLLSAAA